MYRSVLELSNHPTQDNELRFKRHLDEISVLNRPNQMRIQNEPVTQNHTGCNSELNVTKHLNH